MRYPFNDVEPKWQKFWEDKEVFKTDLSDSEKKLYTLVMFIYPSGAKLHVGHWYNYGPTDSWARFKKLQGFNVFEPMGYDAFGLPAENYAIKTGVHPYDSTMNNIRDIRVMLKKMGTMYDWNAELMTCVPEYYKWNQWLFLQLYKKGLAFKKNAPVNWDPVDQTVLANEQVLPDGTAERSGAKVEKRDMLQWFFKITDYAEELLAGLETIDWPEATKVKQRNWIGKSTGTEIFFDIDGLDDKIKVFTTRPDTLFGVTYVVLAPENPLVEKVINPEYRARLDEYLNQVKFLTDIERTALGREKTGVPTGAFAINPVNGEKVPIWVADYVLAGYGTGSVMAVPGHDERDFEFAAKFNLPIRKVILEKGKEPASPLAEAFTEEGTMINSGQFTGLDSEEGIEKINDFLEAEGIGHRAINYKLKDWLISRQRYWGTPIPVIYCEKCGELPVPEESLPVVLPYDVDFKPGGGSPLARKQDFIETVCHKCGGKAERDPDTMDTFVDSSWYYLRYPDPKFTDGMFNKSLAEKWVPVDTYVGGAEHATMHLLYARFIHKFLRDLGIAAGDEPFKRLIHQGTITKDGAKMSKSKGNIVNPDEFIEKYGTDVFRMYLMFMGPYELGGDWSDKGIVGVERFAQRAYTFAMEHEGYSLKFPAYKYYELESLNESEKTLYRKVNFTLNKCAQEIDNFRFNTAVAALMELINEMQSTFSSVRDDLKTFVLEKLVYTLAPLAPHLAEECWNSLGNRYSIYEKPFTFSVDEKALVIDEVTLVIQVNGKVRHKLQVAVDLDEKSLKEIVYADSKIKGYVDGKQIVKEIHVPNKIFNIIVR
ncbi:MAG: leucine--tRNA ligase [Ignavibacteriales bacterium]|nr:leucine--tRNA ligase [Ignavibacteriales bacterium]MCF8316667.1 leucine--tRNA ligase [Ignavibacteriales bacterium]MCF8438323.1 leucine--tRNA ligase [Ignavibacteriales bacterium]